VGELIMAVARRGRMAKTIDGMQRGRTKVFALEVSFWASAVRTRASADRAETSL